jgi:CheY-like chemotaxis protein
MAKKLMVVEDETILRETMVMTLQNAGYTILEASNGNEALQLLKNSAPLPGLILTDIMMPVMDGWEFLEKKTSDPAISAIPVVVLSAYSKQEKPPQVEIAAFLEKPFSIKELIATIADHYRDSQVPKE